MAPTALAMNHPMINSRNPETSTEDRLKNGSVMPYMYFSIPLPFAFQPPISTDYTILAAGMSDL